MSKAMQAAAAIGVMGIVLTSQAHAHAEPADTAAEVVLLKKQLRLMEEKLDKLQKQTTVNATAAAKANAKADASTTGVANARAAIPIKGPIAPSDVVVTMPNSRPTICTADNLNCIAITSRMHFDVGGYDYHPNTAATIPQRLDSGDNVRRARIGVAGKFMGDWNYALVYDFGGTSDGFGGSAGAGGTAVGFLPGGAVSASRTPISAIPASSRSAARSRSKAASWTCRTRWTRRSAPRYAVHGAGLFRHHRHQYCRR